MSEDKGNRMKAELTKTKVQIEKKLREAFSDLNEKAKLFEADDPEVYEEFRQRAQKVKSSLCINNKWKYDKESSCTINGYSVWGF